MSAIEKLRVCRHTYWMAHILTALCGPDRTK